MRRYPITNNELLDIARGYRVDQSDDLESFLCEALEVNSEELYEKLEQTSDKRFRQDATKRAILATIEASYKMNNDQRELLKTRIFGLLDDIKDYPISYAE